jgi:mycoredoxin
MVLGSSYSPYGRRLAPPRIPVVIYGTRWCAQSQMVRRFLDRLGILYEYVDLERDPGALRRLHWLTGGTASHRPSTSAASGWSSRRCANWSGR